MSPGTQGLGNTYGVFLLESSGNRIGAARRGQPDLGQQDRRHPHRGERSRRPRQSQGNLVQANLIGIDRTGTVGGDPIGNASDGVTITNSLDNTIGGTDPRTAT